MTSAPGEVQGRRRDGVRIERRSLQEDDLRPGETRHHGTGDRRQRTGTNAEDPVEVGRLLVDLLRFRQLTQKPRAIAHQRLARDRMQRLGEVIAERRAVATAARKGFGQLSETTRRDGRERPRVDDVRQRSTEVIAVVERPRGGESVDAL